MEEKPQSVNITVQGDMIGNSISLGAVLDTLGAKAPQLGFDTADGDRFQKALYSTRIAKMSPAAASAKMI